MVSVCVKMSNVSASIGKSIKPSGIFVFLLYFNPIVFKRKYFEN